MKKEMKKTVKYGSLSLVFVAVVLAAIVLLNFIVTLIGEKVSLIIDLTDEEVYTISEGAKEFIKGIDTPITIYFCKERDRIDSDGQYVKMVRNLIEEFGKEYDNITVKYIDIDKNKELADKWKKESTITVNPSSIIVEGANGQFRQLYPAGFFSTAQSTGKFYAFKGEITLTNAIIQVSGEEKPKIAFTTGHSEDTNNVTLRQTLTEAGFEVIDIDLSKEDIPEGTKMIFINNPKYDFQGFALEKSGEIDPSENEIDKLAEFMVDFNHIIVTVDPDTPELPELQEFLSEWGLGWQPYTLIKDNSGSMTGFGTKATRLIGKYVMDDPEAAAYHVHKSLSTSASPPRVMFSNATPIVLGEPIDNGTIVAASFTSQSTAEAFKNEMVVDSGEMPLMGVASRSKYIGDAGEQVLIYSTVVLIGTTEFASDSYINGQYGNKEVMYSLARIMGSRRVPNGLDFKVFYDESLVIDQSTAETLTVLISAVAPFIVAIIGFAVFLKRRHL